MSSSSVDKLRWTLASYYNSARVAVSPESVDILVAFLSSAAGTDKTFGLAENWLKLLVQWLRRPRLVQFSEGRTTYRKGSINRETQEYNVVFDRPTVPAADALSTLARLIGDSRMLMRFTGLPGILKWIMSLRRERPRPLLPSLQALCMLLYYPLEHTYYLASHQIINVQDSTKKKLGLWSARCWAAYVVLQLLKLRKDSAQLDKEERALFERGGDAELEITKKRRTLKDDLWMNLYYLPVALHWSLKNGYFRNELWPTVIGALIATKEFRRDWKAHGVLSPLRD